MRLTASGKDYDDTLRISVALFMAFSSMFAWSHIVAKISAFSFAVALVVCSFGTAVFIWRKFNDLRRSIKCEPGLVVFAFVLGACFSWGSYSLAGSSMSAAGFHYGAKIFYLVGYPATAFLFFLLARLIKTWICDIGKRIDVRDRRICIGASACLALLMLAFVSTNSHWYTQYDRVCSLDSGFVLTSILPCISYFDIRHPVLSLIAFPVWSVMVGLAKFVVPAQVATLFCVAGVQLLNIAMIVSSAAMLKSLTNSRSCLILYLVAFPTLLSSVALEKYIVSSFFVVATIYLLAYHKRFSPIGYALSIGVMPTNGFLLFVEFVASGSLKEKMLRVAAAIAITALLVICSGHMSLLNPAEALMQIHETHGYFGTASVSIAGRIISWVNLMQGSLMPMTLDVASSETLIWTGLTLRFEIVALAIIAVAFIGLVEGRVIFVVRAAGVWVAFSFALFVVFNWSPGTSVLFAPLFYWAVVVLFDRGLRCLCERFGPNALRVAMTSVVLLLLITGAMELVGINEFMREFL